MKVLVAVDLQNDYISGALATAEAQKALGAIRERIKKARETGGSEQIFFLRDTHGANYLNTAEGRSFPTMHCVIDTDGWKLIDGLFEENDSVIDKTSYGSVRLTAVIGKIDPEEVEIFGFGAEKGVLSNAIIMRSALRETRITVNSSLCAAQTPEALETALDAMRQCGVNVI